MTEGRPEMSGSELIRAERRRQIDVEGWTAEHDDKHGADRLLAASRCYQGGKWQPSWPWGSAWWKPRDMRSNLIRAGALAQAAADVALRRRDHIAAEIDRLSS
jgi:hypothetical protein